jgi:hypothetical protein
MSADGVRRVSDLWRKATSTRRKGERNQNGDGAGEGRKSSVRWFYAIRIGYALGARSWAVYAFYLIHDHWPDLCVLYMCVCADL